MATLLRQIGLVSEVKDTSFSELARVSAALQKQVARDFAPLWEIQATVDAFAKLEDVPIGYWPVIVQADIGFNAAGIHLDKDGQPFSLVQYEAGWSLTASHEVLEMLGDPFGDRLIAGESIKPGQGRVEYLVEVCDPSEDIAFAYTVNGVTVSDFYTPQFFEPVKNPGVRYGYTAALTGPRQVLKGGYLSWHDPVSDHWWQQTFFGAKKAFRDLGVFDANAKESIRELVDRRTRHRYWAPGASKKAPGKPAPGMTSMLASHVGPLNEAVASSGSKAQSWRAQIAALKTNKDFEVV
jgi:hypothetical protein